MKGYSILYEMKEFRDSYVKDCGDHVNALLSSYEHSHRELGILGPEKASAEIEDMLSDMVHLIDIKKKRKKLDRFHIEVQKDFMKHALRSDVNSGHQILHAASCPA